MIKLLTLSFLILALLFCSNNSFASSEFTELAAELNHMMDVDQKALHGKTDLDFDVIKIDHAKRVEEIVSTYGWPTIEMVGEDASQAAWIIVQHADYDKEFQRRMLRIMKPLAMNNQIAPANYAYLYDRIHRPQLYGTQGKCEGNEFKPFPIENIEDINTRRKSLNMTTAQEYWNMASERMCGRK
ncbi:hypothetical protein CA267_006450 [Alteromonas pelagimontana]|uniref:Uncharacterized protein n=1 Tax=Alteromonas pelagimontana TaxID=1858656 RepID=A0A6M4MBN1_9ALTE|nr:DUF6624 domain-containing protein [Alteromonas pelagimontana]QJR80437.1 hypothetical protein CA267_006450 [Alteromonas pelagimontana]